MNRSNQMLNDLVSIARDGKSFYEHAATKVSDPELKQLFIRIAGVKSQIVADLSNEIGAMGDKPSESGTLVGDISKLYTELRAKLGDKDYTYVARLEQSEDRFLNAFEEARSSEYVSPAAIAILSRLAPEVRQCHELMRTRKQALKRAA